MNKTVAKKITANAGAVHCLTAGDPQRPAVVLLHGMKFQAATWEELGTIDRLAEAGFYPVAMDMPGFGRSPAGALDQDTALKELIAGLQLHKPILVGPSMGGRIVLEFVINHPAAAGGLVLIGAVGVKENRQHLAAIKIPTLIVWGSEDRIAPPADADLLLASLADARKVTIAGAPHPCYLHAPDIWHKALIDFLNTLND